MDRFPLALFLLDRQRASLYNVISSGPWCSFPFIYLFIYLFPLQELKHYFSKKDVLTVCVFPKLLCYLTFARCWKAEGWQEETAGPCPLEVRGLEEEVVCCF